jgi:hypothetical protein
MSVLLSWTVDDNDYLNYRIEKSIDENTWAEIATVGTAVREYKDILAYQPDTYYYRIYGICSNGCESAPLYTEITVT